MAKKKDKAPVRPDQMVVNKLQAGRLARLSGMPADELQGQTIAELGEKLRWRLNPEWFWFELVCGQVVKVDPSTGLKYPVPGAAVNFIDVDCDWLWFFPPGWPWAWAFPWGICEFETMATVTTDDCGKFCAWIPRFDIDWILFWRRERICLPDLFRRPSIGDLLARLRQEVLEQPFPVNPNPPDPSPLVGILADRADVATAIGSGTAARIRALGSARTVGSPSGSLRSMLAGPAFANPIPPPLPPGFRGHGRPEHRELAERLGVEPKRLEKLDVERWYGPFLRCFDVYFPEWLPMFEVPDITIQVTQDTDGDGDQEVIYDQYFGVPWAIPTPNLELDAASFALALPTPGCGPDFPCADTPAIQMVGLMPVDPGFLESTHGFATRPNPARMSGHESGSPTYPSTAPFGGTLQLYGCLHVGDATHYRILAEFASDDGLGVPPTFGAQKPLLEQWHMYHFLPFVDRLQHPVNSDGWYEILDDTWSPIHLVMNWNTGAMGSYRLTVVLGKAVGGVITAQSTAAPVVLAIDNNYPTVNWTLLQWRYQGDVSWTALPWLCPLIARDPDRAVEVQVGITVSAAHLRGAVISAGGCGGAAPTPGSVDHWHLSELDNTWSDATIYTIPAHAPAGCYGWNVLASSRAFNPDGDNDGLGVDWYYDPMYVWTEPQLSVAIVDA